MIRTEIDPSLKKKKCFFSDADECKTRKTHVFTSHRLFSIFFQLTPSFFYTTRKPCLFAYILPLVSALHQESLQR